MLSFLSKQLHFILFPIHASQATNEAVQCAQKTEKGLSGYVYNKQTGLVNKVGVQQLCRAFLKGCIALIFTAVLEEALVRACWLCYVVVHSSAIGVCQLHSALLVSMDS